MGRAERRRLERRNRIEANKDKIRLSWDDVQAMKNKVRDETIQYDAVSLMTCFALAEHRLYGFGQKRIMRSLNYINDLMESISNGNATIEDYVKKLEEETGVSIK